MWGISILADLRWGVIFHAVVVFGMGKNLLFKSALGHSAIIRSQKKFVCTADLMLTRGGQKRMP